MDWLRHASRRCATIREAPQKKLDNGAKMVAIAKKEIQDVLSQVASWPAGDRIVLARKILETVVPGPQGLPRGLSAEEVIAQLNVPQPAPDDAACEHILEDELLRKHGG